MTVSIVNQMSGYDGLKYIVYCMLVFCCALDCIIIVNQMSGYDDSKYIVHCMLVFCCALDCIRETHVGLTHPGPKIRAAQGSEARTKPSPADV